MDSVIRRREIPQDWWRGYLCIYGVFRGGRLTWLRMHEAMDSVQRERLTKALNQAPDGRG